MTIIVSSGPGDATIPFVRGSPQDEATKKLKAAGFKVDVRKEYNDEVAKGKVIETSPAEGQQLTRGTSVTLVVSRGPRQVEVPDVVGKNRDDAEAQLEDLGLKVTFTEREDEDKDAGTVLEMSPAAGTQVREGRHGQPGRRQGAEAGRGAGCGRRRHDDGQRRGRRARAGGVPRAPEGEEGRHAGRGQPRDLAGPAGVARSATRARA